MKDVSPPITSEEALRELIGEPADLVRAKVSNRVNELEPLAVERKTPKLGLLIEIDEVFTHFSKAFVRSGLWDPERFVEREELPSSGEIHRSLNPSFDAERYDEERAERYARREGLY